MNRALDKDSPGHHLLRLVYNLMTQRGSWPTFTAVDVRADRDLGIEDAQAALLAIPAGYLSLPWHTRGFSDSDEVRLTLRAVSLCDGGIQDLQILVVLVRWMVAIENNSDSNPEVPLKVTGVDFAEYMSLPLEQKMDDEKNAQRTAISPRPTLEFLLSTNSAKSNLPTPELVDALLAEPAPPTSEVVATRELLSRLRVLADLLPHFWTSAHWPPEKPWSWQFTLDRRRLRPYRHISDTGSLLEYVASHEHDRPATEKNSDPNTLDDPMASATHALDPTRDSDLDILMTMLRKEIVISSAELVQVNRFDDAIFAAFRRVEHELQERTQNQSIGNDLVKLSFIERRVPIRISEREKDKERLVELFGGAIGLFKGDRSHKDRPLLPCRSRNECLRLLAHASTLLDLLDRDIDRAPAVRGYEHRQGDTLTLWVDRASSQVDVWLDEKLLLKKLSYKPGSLVVDVSRVSPGEHRLHLVDGHRQGTAHTIWLTNNPGLSSWYRVIEVNIPLYGDALGQQQLNVAGVRLSSMEGGVTGERVLPSNEQYQVGHYVSWQWDHTNSIGATWVRERSNSPLRSVWDGSLLFAGQPVAPAHPKRLMHISMQPSRLLLRKGEKVPLRVLAHYTDGVATWTEPLNDPQVETTDEKAAIFKGGTAIAKAPGETTLRCLHSGCSAEASIEVASHPQGTVTELLTALGTVAGIAHTPSGLVVSTRGTDLWRIEKNGTYKQVSAIPKQLFGQGLGTDTLAARADGELAVRLSGSREILILHHGEDGSDDYRNSHIINPSCPGTPMAFDWNEEALVVAMHEGDVFRVTMDGAATKLASLQGMPIAVAQKGNKTLVLCTSRPNSKLPYKWNSLWSIFDNTVSLDLLARHQLTDLSGVVFMDEEIYLSDFTGGRILHLPMDGSDTLKTAATDLLNPAQLATDPEGNLYVAEFGAGSVRRILS